jgi:hypothetical protein
MLGRRSPPEDDDYLSDGDDNGGYSVHQPNGHSDAHINNPENRSNARIHATI